MTADFVLFVYYEVSIRTITKVLQIYATLYHAEVIYEENAAKIVKISQQMAK